MLQAPLSESDVRDLKAGEVVYVAGPVITGRDEMHMRALEYSKEGKPVPDGLKNSVLFHCGPIIKEIDDGWEIVAAGPTTSARMNKLEAEMIKTFEIRAIVGKGGMSKDVLDAMKETGCVYLAATGGAAVSLAEGLQTVTGCEWEDLGMAEAMWKFNAQRFGPLVVAMDSHGVSLYDKVQAEIVRD